MAMEMAAHLTRTISRQLSTGSMKMTEKLGLRSQNSMNPRNSPRHSRRFSFGRQSSLDPYRRSTSRDDLMVPENLDSTMQMLFLACKGEVEALKDLLEEGVDVNSADLDGRTALHIASCEGHVEVVNLLLNYKSNIDARDRWGSTAAGDAKFYGNTEVYNILKALGAKVPKTRKTPMTVENPKEVPEYELNPMDLHFHRSTRELSELADDESESTKQKESKEHKKKDAKTMIFSQPGISMVKFPKILGTKKSKEAGEDSPEECRGIQKGTYQVAKWNGTKVCVKILDKDSYSDPESINAFRHELSLLEKVRHPNVVQFVGAVTQNIPMMIVSEYHSKGDLKTYLEKKRRLSPSRALRFALDIARGINYLHECKPVIIHCDLRPKNILLDSGGQLKIAGFGLVRLSKISPDKAKLSHYDAVDRTSIYMAPEIYKDEIFDRRVDVYSFGVLLYEMSEGMHPFYPKSEEDASRFMCMKGNRPAFKAKSKTYLPELKELIEECWDPDYCGRPTFSQIIVRLDKIVINYSKHGWWKETFKLPWI